MGLLIAVLPGDRRVGRRRPGITLWIAPSAAIQVARSGVCAFGVRPG